MKLLFVVPEYGLNVGGGIATFYRHLLPELVLRGHVVEVLLASEHGQPQPPIGVAGVPVRCLERDAATRHLDRFNAFSAVPGLQRQLAIAWAAWDQAQRGEGFDVIETTDYGMLFVPWAANQDSPAVVVQMHGSNGQLAFHDPMEGCELERRLSFLLEAALLPRVSELQSYGRPNARAWSSLLAHPVEYVPAGWKAPLSVPGEWNGQPHGDHALVVGRIQCWKGPEVLCEAARLLGEQAPSIDWLGSDKSYRRRTQSMSEFLARHYPDVWGRKIRPIGPRSTAETAALQAAAAFIVVPSTWDVFNLAAVEGMGLRRVVLCSRGAGAAELIQDGANGLTFAATDPVALAEKLRQASTMSGLERERMGQLAQRTVAAALDPGSIADARINRYRSLIKRSPGELVACPDWLAITGPDSTIPSPAAFLDRLPLKMLAGYAIKRMLQRIVGKPR